MSAVTADSVAHLLREPAPRVLGAVARRHADFAAAEDAIQEALIAATRQWPVAGLPDNPRGWLYRVAMRRLLDHVRSEEARRRREEAAGDDVTAGPPPRADDELGPDRDDTLLLLFMCCHPSLTPGSAIVLTLRAVGGLTTAEIARAFLVPEATMAQRVGRAKAAIRASGVPFALPASPCSSRSISTRASPATTGWTRCAGTCTSAPASEPGRSSTIAPRRSGR